MKLIYLDNAATTKVDERIIQKMFPFFTEKYANPATKWTSSLSKEVDFYVEQARADVAHLIGAEPEEIFFTSGGTESDNTALKGIAMANQERGNEIISTKIEHEAVLKPLSTLERMGFVVKFVNVDKYGFVDPDEVKKLISKKTLIISIMHANNEIGTIEPIKEIGKISKENEIYFHTDAVQTVGHIRINVKEMNIDLLSLSAHKFYGPKGVGAIYIRKGTKIKPFMEGGGQENGIRSGSLNTTGVVGLGEAAKIAEKEMDSDDARIKDMRNLLWKKIEGSIPKVFLNGPQMGERLSGNLNFLIEGIRNEPLLVLLNERGIIAGGGSACSAGSKEPSHVLKTIGIRPEDYFSSIRITIGKFNSKDEIDPIVNNLIDCVKKLRELSPFWKGGE